MVKKKIIIARASTENLADSLKMALKTRIYLKASAGELKQMKNSFLNFPCRIIKKLKSVTYFVKIQQMPLELNFSIGKMSL